MGQPLSRHFTLSAAIKERTQGASKSARQNAKQLAETQTQKISRHPPLCIVFYPPWVNPTIVKSDSENSLTGSKLCISLSCSKNNQSMSVYVLCAISRDDRWMTSICCRATIDRFSDDVESNIASRRSSYWQYLINVSMNFNLHVEDSLDVWPALSLTNVRREINTQHISL